MTNDLMRDVIEGRIPMPARFARGGLIPKPQRMADDLFWGIAPPVWMNLPSDLRQSPTPVARIYESNLTPYLEQLATSFDMDAWQIEFMQRILPDHVHVPIDGTEWDSRPEPPADPRERALWATQHRNTGPATGPLRATDRNNHYKTKR